MTTTYPEPDEPRDPADEEFDRFRWDTAALLREATGWRSVARFIIATEPGALK